MGKASVDGESQRIRHEIASLGWTRPGSVIRRYMPCGNPSCRCMADPPLLHGPYYQWSHKLNGKTRSLRLSESQAALCLQWARNHKQLKQLVRKLEKLALQETDRILGAIS